MKTKKAKNKIKNWKCHECHTTFQKPPKIVKEDWRTVEWYDWAEIKTCMVQDYSMTCPYCNNCFVIKRVEKDERVVQSIFKK